MSMKKAAPMNGPFRGRKSMFGGQPQRQGEQHEYGDEAPVVNRSGMIEKKSRMTIVCSGIQAVNPRVAPTFDRKLVTLTLAITHLCCRE